MSKKSYESFWFKPRQVSNSTKNIIFSISLVLFIIIVVFWPYIPEKGILRYVVKSLKTSIFLIFGKIEAILFTAFAAILLIVEIVLNLIHSKSTGGA